MDKPDVDFIEGLSPAISIDQKSASRNPRSTVGTITEIYDYLRLLYARIGVPHCPQCGRPITRQTPQQIVDRVLELPEGTRFQVLAPVVRGRKGEYEALLADLGRQGYTRARVDGEVIELTEHGSGATRLARYEQHTIEVVVDRLVRRAGDRAAADRLPGDGAAAGRGRGRGRDRRPRRGRRGGEGETLTFSQHLACPTAACRSTSWRRGTSRSTRPTAPASAATGSAPASRSTPSWSSRDDDLSHRRRAPSPLGRFRGEYFGRVARGGGRGAAASRRATPWKKLEEGRPARSSSTARAPSRCMVQYRNRYGRARSYSTRYEGVIPWLSGATPRPRATGPAEQIEGYMREVPCPGVRRLPGCAPPRWPSRSAGRNIHEVTSLAIRDVGASSSPTSSCPSGTG